MAKIPGYIRRRGAGWTVCLHVDGRRHDYGPRKVPLLRHGTREDIDQWAWAEYRRLVRQAQSKASGDLRVSELIQRWREYELPGLNPGGRQAYEDSLKPIASFFVERSEDPVIRRVETGDVVEYMAWRRTARIVRPIKKPPGKRTKSPRPKPVTAHTVAKDRRALHRMFEFARELKLIDANPVTDAKPPKADPRTPHILTADEYDRLLEACDDDFLRLWVLVLAESGARSMSEVLHLRWEDIDLPGGFLRIVSGRDGHRTKAGSGRWTPLTTRLADALRDHMARYRLVTYDGQRTPWVFHHTRTSRRGRAGARIVSLHKRFTDAVQRAGVPKIRPHDLRHRRVTVWLAEGKNPVHVKEAVGHADLATTMKYTHLAREHLRALVDEPAADSRLKKA